MLLLGSLIKYGWGLHPEWHRFVDAAQHWQDVSDSLLAVGDRALLANALPAIVAGALHLSSEHAYVTFSCTLTGLAIFLPLLLRMRATSISFRRLYVIVGLGGSLAPVLAMWIGGYDALLTCFLTVAVLSRHPVMATGAWLLAAFTHSAVAIPAAALWCTFTLLSTGQWRTRRAWLSAGIAGLACLVGFLAIHELTNRWGGSTDRFALWQQIPFSGILQCYAHAFPAIVFSGLGITWLLVALPPLRRLADTSLFLTLAIATTLLVPLIAVDETRITALILLPLTLAWLDRVAVKVPARDVTIVWRWMLVPALLLPVCVVWMGSVHWPYWL